MCNCAKQMDERLKPMNYRLVRNLLERDPPVLVEIGKVMSKQRTPSYSLVASYCPFCGEKYPERATHGVLKNTEAA